MEDVCHVLSYIIRMRMQERESVFGKQLELLEFVRARIERVSAERELRAGVDGILKDYVIKVTSMLDGVKLDSSFFIGILSTVLALTFATGDSFLKRNNRHTDKKCDKVYESHNTM